ncbi:MAG TPA: alginate export family protein, partial [Steroidobacter sp.]|nr:alginate export family protein [Steroidobacter sp.]
MDRFCVAAVAVLSGFAGVASAAPDTSPWRLGQTIDAPGWLSVSGSYRARYETLNHPYRAGATGSDEILVGRLFLNARATVQNFYANFELEDARQQLANSGTALGTDSVNTLEPVQFLVGMRFNDVFSPGARLDVSAGRMTIDLGARRLVARNNFRNTTNAYTGVHTVWKGADGFEARAFYVRPVQRKPSDLAALLDNDIELDTDSSDVTLWGAFGAAPELFGNVKGEAYFFG